MIRSVHYSSLSTAEQLEYTHLYVSSNNLLGNYADSKKWIETYPLPKINDETLIESLFDYSIRAAWAYEATQDYTQAMHWYRTAENYGVYLGDNDKRGYVYLQYSAVKSLQGNQYEALKLANEAYFLLSDSLDAEMVSDLYSQLGILYYLNGDYNNAIQFQEKVLAQALKDQSSQEIAVAHYNVANAYFKWSKVDFSQDKIQTASQNYQQGLKLAQKIQAKYLQRNNLLGLISLYSFSGSLSDASTRVQELLSLNLEYSGYSELSYHLVLADYYQAIGDTQQQRQHLLGATLYYAAPNKSFPAYALDKQKDIAELYASIGEYELAYEWLNKYSEHAIGRYKSQTQQKVKDLQSEIENQRLAIENRDLTEQVQIRFWLIATIIFVLLLSLGLLYQQRKKKQLFYQLSNIDFLTGLSNRRHIFEWGESKFTQHKLSSIIFDIDHFKVLNDTHGHDLGDEVLKQVSDIVSNATRKQDVVGRIGGEEFLILLPEVNKEQLAKIAENIRSKIATHSFKTKNERTLKVTASFGIAEHQSGALSDQVNLADTALYRAKRSGRNRCVFAT
ncbi:tetratricopeptide repeat-containing diguanylate cyclase [Vibrio aquaticus]|nr:tetratricopeptide repeat-containing diguanylate cyclase [Vibrio aquaticus]